MSIKLLLKCINNTITLTPRSTLHKEYISLLYNCFVANIFTLVIEYFYSVLLFLFTETMWILLHDSWSNSICCRRSCDMIKSPRINGPLAVFYFFICACQVWHCPSRRAVYWLLKAKQLREQETKEKVLNRLNGDEIGLWVIQLPNRGWSWALGLCDVVHAAWIRI